jgi:hypothetical protein
MTRVSAIETEQPTGFFANYVLDMVCLDAGLPVANSVIYPAKGNFLWSG